LEPKVILMDEPCSALDPIATQTIEALISQLSEHYTVIICTHNLAQARRLSDQLVLLWHDGRTGFIAETGATERMFDSQQTAQAQAYFSGQLG
jgi:phosphate transport system ATP-binding protein